MFQTSKPLQSLLILHSHAPKCYSSKKLLDNHSFIQIIPYIQLYNLFYFGLSPTHPKILSPLPAFNFTSYNGFLFTLKRLPTYLNKAHPLQSLAIQSSFNLICSTFPIFNHTFALVKFNFHLHKKELSYTTLQL